MRSSAWLHRRLIDVFYVDAMVLADEARSYFDDDGHGDRDSLSPLDRVAFGCESLKLTTRLMHVMAWLLTQRAIDAGDMAPCDMRDPTCRLGAAPVSDPAMLSGLPERARDLIVASTDLYRRVSLLDAAQAGTLLAHSPARSMQQRLATAF